MICGATIIWYSDEPGSDIKLCDCLAGHCKSSRKKFHFGALFFGPAIKKITALQGDYCFGECLILAILRASSKDCCRIFLEIRLGFCFRVLYQRHDSSVCPQKEADAVYGRARGAKHFPGNHLWGGFVLLFVCGTGSCTVPGSKRRPFYSGRIALMFASTNLVIELGVLILIFLGWQYLAAELAGGVVLIAISSVVI